MDNGYPLNLIFKKIYSRLKTLIYNNRKCISGNTCDLNLNSSGENKKIIVFPYINKLSESIAATLDSSQYITGYRILNNLGRFIRVRKDTNNFFNHVVYKILCNDCSASYVGQTKRQLKTRTKEHINNSKSTSSKPSVITEHMIELSHSFDWNNVKILDMETNYFKRSVSEMLHIREQRNGINAKKDTELLDDSYNYVLDMLSKF